MMMGLKRGAKPFWVTAGVAKLPEKGKGKTN
jgi:hypothetical protein